MILGAAVLVLVALGLFVGGIVTGVTALYWACVALSLVAAVLLILARRQLARPEADEARVTRQDDVVAARSPEPPAGTTSVPTGTAARRSTEAVVEEDDDEAPVEEVEVTDLLLVMDLHDEVVVVDEHPRYHLADCSWLRGRTPIALPLHEARTDGFTPCGVCAPDRHLAAVERERRGGKGTS